MFFVRWNREKKKSHAERQCRGTNLRMNLSEFSVGFLNDSLCLHSL